MNQQETGALGERLVAEEYLRRRIQPRIPDHEYLILADLLELLKKLSPAFEGDVFDYGCGGAPYRHLFARCRSYVRADVNPVPGVERLLNEDGSTQEAPGRYDLVLSTQVLEHVRRPAQYLQECHRLLRPGGRVLITTHGMIEEHACPDDFQRWTARGLEELVASSGFRVLESGKLTTEARALFQLLHQMMYHLRCDERPWLRHALAVVRRLYFALAVPCLNWFAGFFASQARAAADSPAGLYCCIYVWAEKSNAA